MSAGTNPLRAELIAGLADNKYFLGRRYAEWCTAAPALESAVAAAAMAQDEIGHARSLYPLLQDISGVTDETVPETRTQFTNAAFLGQTFEGWTDFVAANFLFDTAMTVMLEAARASTFEALAQRARRMLEEEHLHWLHGEGWTRRLAREGAGVRSTLQRSFTRTSLDALAWFELADLEFVRDGTLDTGAADQRARYRARVNPVLRSVSLEEIE